MRTRLFPAIFLFVFSVVLTLVGLTQPVWADAERWNQAQIDQLRRELPILQEDRVLYHWGDPRRISRWMKQGQVDAGEVAFLNTPTGDRQVYGPGIYLAEDPVSTNSYGEMVSAFRVRSGTRLYDEEIVRRILGRTLSPNEQAALGQEVGFVRKITEDWWTIHDSSATQEVSSAISERVGNGKWQAPVLIKRDTPVTLVQATIMDLRDADPARFGYLSSFSHLARYQDGISFLRSVQVNPGNPWAEFEGGSFEAFRTAREDIYRRVHDSWSLTQYRDSDTPKFVRTDASPIGISENGKFASKRQSKEEWVRNQMRILTEMRASVSGQTSAESRGVKIRAGGSDTTIVKKGKTIDAMRVSDAQLVELRGNRFLKIDSVPDTEPGYHRATIEYPSVYRWKQFRDRLSPELVGRLESGNVSATRAGSPDFQRFNQAFLDDLLKSTFAQYHGRSIDESSALMRDLVSIHPGADFNGRSIRLYIEAAEIESNQVPGYHFVSDLDLFTSPAGYGKITKTGGAEYALFQARALSEAVAARNVGGSANLHALPTAPENLVQTFHESFESLGMKASASFTHEQNELIRTRNWTRLLGRFGDPDFDLRNPDNWNRMYERYVAGKNGEMVGFSKKILDVLPENLKNGMKIDSAPLQDALNRAPIKTRLAILRSVVEAPQINTVDRLDALVKLMGRKSPQVYFQNGGAGLDVAIKLAPEMFSEADVLAMKKPLQDWLRDRSFHYYEKFYERLAKFDSRPILELRAALLLNHFQSSSRSTYFTNGHFALLKEASAIYASPHANSPIRQAIKFAVLHDRAIDKYAEAPEIQKALKNLSDELRTEIASENIISSALKVRRWQRITDPQDKRAYGDKIAEPKILATYFEALNPKALVDPDIQRAERVLIATRFLRSNPIKTLAAGEDVDAAGVAALENRRKKLVRTLESAIDACSRKKCSKDQIAVAAEHWNLLYDFDPENSKLLSVLSWQPEVLPDSIWNGLMNRQQSRTGLSAEIKNQFFQHLSYRFDKKPEQHHLVFADRLERTQELLLNVKTATYFRLPEKYVKAIILELGIADSRVQNLIKTREMSGQYIDEAVIAALNRGQIEFDQAAGLSLAFREIGFRNLPEALKQLAENPDAQKNLVRAAVARELNRTRKSTAVSVYSLIEGFGSYTEEMAKISPISFDDWDMILKSTASVTPYSQSKLTDTVFRAQPEIMEEVVRRAKVGEDVSHWARALGGTITNSDDAFDVLQKLVQHDSKGEILKVIADNVGGYSAADKMLRKLPEAKLAELTTANPKLLGQLGLSDKKLMETLAQVPAEASDVKTSVGDASGGESSLVASKDPKLLRICLQLGILVGNCRVGKIRHDQLYLLNDQQLGHIFEAAVLEKEISKAKDTISRIYDKANVRIPGRTIKSLIELLDRYPESGLNTFYAHALVDRAAYAGDVFLNPADQWRFAKAVRISKESIFDSGIERAVYAASRAVIAPPVGIVRKGSRACVTGFRKIFEFRKK